MIDMARESCFEISATPPYFFRAWEEELKAFEALVRADERKQALAAPVQDMPKIGCVNHDCDRCKAAAPVQEPVAWLLYKGTHKESFWLDKGDAYNFEMTPEHRWEPLYTTPPAAQPDIVRRAEEAFEAAAQRQCEGCAKIAKP
jgi:hypothetical protein